MEKNILELKNEIIRKEYLTLITHLSIYNYDATNSLDLMKGAYGLINNWRLMIKEIFEDGKTLKNNKEYCKLLMSTSFNNLEYNNYVKTIFNSYQDIIIEMKIFTYYMYKENPNNLIAKCLSYAFEKDFVQINNIDQIANELYNYVLNGENVSYRKK